MQKLIIDPSRDGCELWYGDYVTSIKRRSVEDTCLEIVRRTTYTEKNKIHQIMPVCVDITSGIGIFYKDYLTSMGLSVSDIKATPDLDKVLPVTNTEIR